MTTTKNNEHKKLNFSSEREQSQVCLDSAEHEKNQGRKVLNVPNLRFKEFQGEWEKSKLSDLCTFFSGGTPSSSNKDFYGGDIAFIRSGELHANSTELFISQDGYDNSSAKMVEIGDLLLAMYGATSGDIAISKIKGAINQAILCIRTNQNKKFIESVWNKHVSKILRKYLQGGQGNLSADIVKGISFSFPTLEEQERIANLISLLDERIATQNKIIDKLQSLIKGIAQKIVRSNKPNVRLSECLECNSSTLQESDVCEHGTYPVYGANGIVGYLNNYNTEGEAVYIIKDGSGVGTVSYVTGKCSATGTLNTLQAKEGYFLQYLYYLLKVFNFEPYKTGMAIPHIYFKDYGKAKVFCPSYTEQLQYARLLSAIESNLSIEINILTNLSLQKQYLLRQMFI